MKLLQIILLFVFNYTCLFSQDSGVVIYQETHLNAACEPFSVVRFSLEDEVANEWPLPYQVTMIDVTAGEPEYYEITEDGLIVEDVLSGTYEITIYLDEECKTIQELIIEQADISDVLNFEITADCNNDGSITLLTENLNVPVNVMWADGNTDTSREDLIHGVYGVTVTDNNGCSLSSELIIDEYHQLTEPSLKFILPSNCFEPTGAISFFAGSNGGAYGNKTYTWSNGDEGLGLQNVFPGTYTLNVTDESGCEANFDYVVPGDQKPEINVLTLEPSCENSGMGLIFVEVDNVDFSDLSFSWSNGNTVPYITDVFPGSYCLTVTNTVNNCITNECYEIPSLGTSTLQIIDYDQLNVACEGEENASVRINTEGGVGTLHYKWDGKYTNSNVKNNLKGGTYNVIVEDRCGLVDSITVFVEEHDIEYEILESCDEGSEFISVQVSGDHPPFTIEWTDAWADGTEGFTRWWEHQRIMSFDIIDSYGCIISSGPIEKSSSRIEVVSKVPACSGIPTASVQLQFHNITSELANGKYREVTDPVSPWQTLFSDLDDEYIDFELSSLFSDRNYEVLIETISGCTYTMSIGAALIHKHFDLVYDRDTIIDDVHFCIFDHVCDSFIIDDAFTSPANINFTNSDFSSVNFFGVSNCQDAMLTCAGDTVGVLEGNAKRMRGLEALAFYQAINLPADLSLFQENPCATFFVCPYNGGFVTMLDTWPYAGSFEVAEPINDSCFIIRCEYPTIFLPDNDYVLCDDIVEDVLADYFIPPDPPICGEKITNNVGHLLENLDSLYDAHDNLEGSSLGDFLNTVQDSPGAWCSDVVYCIDGEGSFQVLYSDIDVNSELERCHTLLWQIALEEIREIYDIVVDTNGYYLCEPFTVINKMTGEVDKFVICPENGNEFRVKVLPRNIDILRLQTPSNDVSKLISSLLPETYFTKL